MQPHVTIFLAMYKGYNFIVDQLLSINDQIYKNWTLVVSDDTDDYSGMNLVKTVTADWQNEVVLIKGPRTGYVNNFLSMANSKDFKSDFYAFCDQDDYWLPNKLQVAVDHLKAFKVNSPVFYCGRTTYVTESLHPFGSSPLFRKTPTFNNALVQSIAGGNTMVFNHKCKVLLENSGVYNVPSHDWWLYILATGAGGHVIYDENSYVLYRQHQDSLIGHNSGLFNTLRRIRRLCSSKVREQTNVHVEQLKLINSLLTQSSREVLDNFLRLRNLNFLQRSLALFKLPVYRQTLKGSLSLRIAVILGLF